MKSYQYIEATDGVPAHLQMTDSQGLVWTVPIAEANSDYAEYLRYTAWVEAGNNPEDFWSQSDDFLDTSVSEVSQPKEEEGES